jgi:hypothetical protein
MTMATGGDRDDPGRRNRRALWFALAIGVVAVGVRVAVATHSLLGGAAASVGMVGFLAGLIAWSRRRVRRGGVNPAEPLALKAILDFTCLPGEWPALARETMAAASANAPGLSVQVTTGGGWLTATKRRFPGSGRQPFVARVPLGAVQDVTVARSRLTLLGSSLNFHLVDDGELRADVALRPEEAAPVAERIAHEARQAAHDPLPGPAAVEVTTPPPPPRTPPAMAGVLMMAAFLPFIPAMIGAKGGPFAALGSLGVVFLALGLMMVRPVGMAHTLAKALVVLAAAFAVDALVAGELLRVGGSALCLALAAWMSKPRALGRPA